MSIESGRIINTSPPTPEQLQNLAAIGIAFASERDCLRTADKLAHVTQYFKDHLLHLVEMESDNSQLIAVRHQIGMSMYEYTHDATSEQAWSLRYYDSYAAQNQKGITLLEKAAYAFTWTGENVLMARRALTLCNSTYVESSLDDALDHFSIPDDIVPILHATEQVQTVTGEDCDVLINEVAGYIDQLEMVRGR